MGGDSIQRSPSGAPFCFPKAVQPGRQEAELDHRLIFPMSLLVYFPFCFAKHSPAQVECWKVISGFSAVDFHMAISPVLFAGSGTLSSDCCFPRSCG